MILLLENKDKRYKDNITNINEAQNIDIVLGDEKCNALLDSFLQDTTVLNSFDVIIIHESIYYADKRYELLKNIESFCVASGKNMIIFSGNNTQPYLRSNILEISAKNLYHNLKEYLEEYKEDRENILVLAYGKKWKLNILLNALERINIFREDSEEESVDFDEFEDDFDLRKIEKIVGKNDYNNLFKNIDMDDEITLQQIKLLTTSLRDLIKEKANE